ncbi:MAG: glycosyl transferase family protein [Erythrobacter sp.]|uniref:glycosyl transferase family protein n=1 Tax=Erythrobacter sp. TaxID=1042 RepID=UPI00263674D0|nr:glycosyl transferase family protein [Erythrobacter sp.]MDJ0979962.1 glycosyl transferase family protein [Erythrobacter sp.]
MVLGYYDFWQWLALVQHELLLFAGVFFLIGALDDIIVDGIWIWLKLTGRAKTPTIDRQAIAQRQLNGPVAVFVPAWREANVIGDTIRHMLAVWPQADLRLYIGCYRNDPDTIAAAMSAASTLGSAGDNRLRIVIHDRLGPSTKADCLNRLHQALRDDERRSGRLFECVVFHDAEDMVDPAGLSLLDNAVARGADFAQLPVEPMPQKNSRWLGSHYCEEFAEAHGKGMVVRSAIGAALPGAGVGCAISRRALHQLSRGRLDGTPFEANSLTEDYELGLAVDAMGGASRFVRVRGEDGRIVATRAFFPSKLSHVVRQKTRWIHGIALQGWDRVGWTGSAVETWMRARDRRGPLTALVLLVGYTLLALTLVLWVAIAMGSASKAPVSPLLVWLLAANFAAFLWRVAWRFGFTAQTHGWAEGMRAVLRIPFTNVIAILAGRRAVAAYGRTLLGRAVEWDKTPHFTHPASAVDPDNRSHAKPQESLT